MDDALDIERHDQLIAYLRDSGRIEGDETPACATLTGGVSNRTVLVERAGRRGVGAEAGAGEVAGEGGLVQRSGAGASGGAGAEISGDAGAGGDDYAAGV